MKNESLERLIANNTISSYTYVNLTEDDLITEKQIGFRNRERLTLKFPNGEQLIIGTFCSGVAEDTVLLFDESNGS